MVHSITLLHDALNAECVIAIVMLSVSLFICSSVSLTYHGHIRWITLKVITRIKSSLESKPNIGNLFQGKHTFPNFIKFAIIYT